LETGKEEEFTSNFIESLKDEIWNNKTLAFRKLYGTLEPYCSSYPLMIRNKDKVIKILRANLVLSKEVPEAVVLSVLDMLT
jgi:hypothetical protein